MPALFPYQDVGAAWLASKRLAYLADEMGVGKTAQAIRALDLVNANRILVLTTAVARINWCREFERFGTRGLRLAPVLSSSTKETAPNGFVTSYDLVQAPKLQERFAGRWDALICDEAHLVKSPYAARTRAVLVDLAHRSDRVWCLSGTPAPNHAGELWPILRTFGATDLDYEAFVERYCVGYEYQRRFQITGSKNIEELKTLMQPYLLRRRKTEVLKDLPPIMYADVVVEPGPVDFERWWPEVTMYGQKALDEVVQKIAQQEAVIDSLLEFAGHGEQGMASLAALQGTPSIKGKVYDSRRYTGLQKVGAVVQMVTDEINAKAYDKIVLFAYHRDVIVDLYERFQKAGFKPVMLFGGTDPTNREKYIRRFQTNPACKVFIGNIKAAGTAITLTAAHRVGFVECSWVPGDNAQAAMRVHRIGQTTPVTVRFFALANSSDEKLQQVLRRKTRDLTRIFGDDAPARAVVDPFAD